MATVLYYSRARSIARCTEAPYANDYWGSTDTGDFSIGLYDLYGLSCGSQLVGVLFVPELLQAVYPRSWGTYRLSTRSIWTPTISQVSCLSFASLRYIFYEGKKSARLARLIFYFWVAPS